MSNRYRLWEELSAKVVRRVQVNGFTLVELIAVLLITAIIAAAALPRFFDRTSFDSHSFHTQAMSMMRHAQKLAIAQNRNVHVRLDGTSLAFCFSQFSVDGSCSDPVPAPGGKNSGSIGTLAACGNDGSWFCEAIPAGIGYVATPAVQRFYFSALGKPFLPGDTAPDSSFQRLRIDLSGGGMTRSILVEHETGYVHS